MNLIHETVYRFLELYYPDARAQPLDAANITVTMPNGSTYTLGINLLGEILTDTGAIIAAPTSPQGEEFTRYVMPDEWTIQAPL